MNFEAPKTNNENDSESQDKAREIQTNLAAVNERIASIAGSGWYEYSQEDAEFRLGQLASRVDDMRSILENMGSSKTSFERVEAVIEAMHTALGGDVERADRIAA